MWKTHTALLVILSVAVSPLLASEQQKSRVLSHCPDFKSTTLSRENKVLLSAKQNLPVRQVPAKAANGGIKLDSITEVSADITTNQIWTAGNTYHITAGISVQALLVIEPGTTVTFASGTTMAVDNGGALISAGTPDNPIVYTSDSATPNYGDYNCPIYIEETASHSTKVTYSYIEYAYAGIFVINNRLDSPIENNYFYYNSYGIVETGTALTDIQNNLLYYSDNAGMDVNMASDTGAGDARSSILIANNTCDSYQSVGILVRGVANPDEAGQPVLLNNIVSQSYYYGIALVNGYMAYTLANTGYYGNTHNTYTTYTDETNPVVETTMPYITGTGTMPGWYLRPNSVFVNASNQYIEQTRLIGKTTSTNGFPDSNKADLGFHYPNWHFSNAGASDLTADFDNSCTVDFNDLLVFADYWLYDYNDNYNCWSWDLDDSGVVDLADFEVIADKWLTSFDFVDFADFAQYWRRTVDYKFQNKRFDLNGDGFVNFKDFAMFADQWRQTTQSTDPNIQIQISGNPNNGYVDVGVSGYSPDTRRIFLLANGKYIGEIYRFKDGDMLTMDISGFSGGEQQLKVISVNNAGRITCSNIKPITFSNPLTYCALPEHYVQNQPLYFAGMYNGTGNVSVNVYANGGNLVWSQTYSGDNIFGSIPADITNQYEFDYVSFTEVSTSSSASGLHASGSAGGGASVIMITDPEEPPISLNVQALIVLPKWYFIVIDWKTVTQIQASFKNRGIVYARLSCNNATYDKVAWYVRNKNIKYLYISCTDGFYRPDRDEPLRTTVFLYDGPVVSIKRSDYPNPNSAPSWCVQLNPNEADEYHSFATMGFSSLEFAYFDVCYSGRLKINGNNELVEGQAGQQGLFDIPHSDMSFALGMANSGRSNFYQGWYNEALVRPFPGETDFQLWTQWEWSILGEGGNLYDALLYTIDRQTEFNPWDPVNNYRLKGMGYMDDIVLRNW